MRDRGAEVFTVGELLRAHSPTADERPPEYSYDDPPRIYLKNATFPGAAFSRSVGDFIAGGGVAAW